MPFQHQVVEGEPGIFPDPVARVLRAVGGLFGRWSGRSDSEPEPTDQPPDAGEPEAEPEGKGEAAKPD